MNTNYNISKFQIRNLLIAIASIINFCSYSQLGFCNGSKGDPIFTENFGTGSTYGPALPSNYTSYTFISGTPNDGEYTISNQTNLNDSWHNAPDHTPDNQPNGSDGRSLVVNASFAAGEFYKRTVSGLCVNTDFEFSAWLMNVYNPSLGTCAGTGIPVDVTFEIWDVSETTLLKSGSTGPINGITNPLWQQFGLTFTTPPGQTSVVLKMKNNGIGGCGNDLAIDDIAFRSCGDFTTITSPSASGNVFRICSDLLPVNLPLNINISNTTPHVFQWQESTDQLNWNDIPGANGLNYNINNLTATHYYRVKVAQDAANLANTFCLTVSETFSVLVAQKPVAPMSGGDKTVCSIDPIPDLTVTPATGENVDWYDLPAGGNLILSGSPNLNATVSGTYYAEAYVPNQICKSDTRTPVKLTINPSPVVTDEIGVVCENGILDLDAKITGVTYLWSSSQTSQIITIDTPGVYTVTVTTPELCTAVKTFTITENLSPTISNVETNDDVITIIMANTGDFEYSLDGIDYQLSNVFTGQSGGLKTAFVRERNGCGEDEMEFVSIIVPKFFTPNNDGYNDVFFIDGLSSIPNATMYIFDRFGKLVQIINAANSDWNGTFNGKPLSTSDYWYRLTLENGREYKGHFSIKR